MTPALDQLGTVLDLSPGETQLLAETLRSQYARGVVDGVRKSWDERKHPRGQPDNAGQFVGAERAPLFELGDGDDEPDHSAIHDKWSNEDSAIEEQREQERDERDEKHDKARERDREDAQDRSIEEWGKEDKRIVKERETEDEKREWARVREDEKTFGRIRREVERDRESELTAAKRVRDKAAAEIDREYKRREEQVFKLDTGEETGEEPPEEYHSQLDALEKWYENRTDAAEEKYNKAVAAIENKYDSEFDRRHDEYREQQDTARRAEGERISDARQKEDDDLEKQRDADFKSFDEKYDEDTERLRTEMHAKHAAAHARQDREQYHARRESHPDAHVGYYTDDDHKRHTGELKAFNPAQPRDEAGRWSGGDSPHKPTHALTDVQRDLLRQLSQHFPDGIHHLLDGSGRVDSAHVTEPVSPEQQQEADQLRETWNVLNDAVEAKLREADDIEMYDLADDSLTSLLNATLYNGDFAALDNGDAVRENEAVADAIDDIGEALRDLDAVPYPKHPQLPPEEEYRRLADEHLHGASGYENHADLLSSYADEVQERRESLDSITAELEGARDKAVAVSQEYRDALARRLEWLADSCEEALQVPADDWDGLADGSTLRATVEDLAQRVVALREHFGERKAMEPEAAIAA